MNQKKIGDFLKELRKEKSITQQQFAEMIGVSNRTVSRWETGSNMPDLDLVIIIADYYDVDIREILDGERKSEKMDKETKETILKIADYSNEEKVVFTKRLNVLFIVGVFSIILFLVVDTMDFPETGLIGFIKGVSLGISLGMLIVGALYTSGYFWKIKAFKKRIINM